MIRRFWRAFTQSLASCSLLRAARSRRSGGSATTVRTVRQVTRSWPPAFRSSAASSSAVGVLSPLFLSPRLSLLRWPVPPHCQHTDCLFLWLSAGLYHVNTDAIGPSVTGNSSWPSHSTWGPTSIVAWSARRMSRSRMSSSVISATNTQIFKARCPRVSSTSASHDGDRPSRTHLRDALSARPPLSVPQRCLASRQSQMPQRRWSRGTASPASSRQRPVCPRSFCLRNLLSSSFRPTLMALILFSSLSSTSFLLTGTHVSKFV
jgi:hypothetical protein